MIVVTGGAGFIGSNLVAALCARGEQIVVCDRLGGGDKWRNVAKRQLEDLIGPEDLAALVAAAADSIKAVVHLGAVSDTTARDGDAVVASNFRLSRQLWLACSRHQIPFIYASSAATYGNGDAGFRDDLSADYLARLRPLNLYGWSKHLFDRWVARRLADGGERPPQWSGLKFFNVYGPGEYHKSGQSSVAYQLHGQLKEGGQARLFRSHHPDYADGGQLRDFIWVGDCVDIMLWLLDNPAVSGLFNAGTGRARSFADLARALFTAMQRPEDIEYIPCPEEIREKYQYFTQADTAHLRGAGFQQAFTTLEDGVATYLNDYLEGPDPYP